MLCTVNERVIFTAITQPPEVIVNQFFSVSVSVPFFLFPSSSKGQVVTLLMFCLLNPQMNACEPNPKTTSSDFNR